MDKRLKVLVVGGGPAGSTAAALLAQAGMHVTLMEREIFPRYHIGESLLPSILEILTLTGARERFERHGFVQKPGGYFDWGGDRWSLMFAEQPAKYKYSYQVIRSEFDQILLENAETQGARVILGAEVYSVRFTGSRGGCAAVMQVGGKREWIDFDFLVDASGRSGLLARKHIKNRRRHLAFDNVAIFGYWRGGRPLRGKHKGAIAVGSIDDGWIWGIPLHNGMLSVGVVVHKSTFVRNRRLCSLQSFYQDRIKSSALLSDMLIGGDLLLPLRVDSDYSYVAESFAGPGYFMVGDAACFLDPLLSTGVHLATYSALLAAASIASIARGEVSEPEAVSFYEQAYRQVYYRLLFFIAAFYDQNRRKEDIFWHAQQLTRSEHITGDLKGAFLRIVSGLEDLEDAGDPVRLRVTREIYLRLESSLRSCRIDDNKEWPARTQSHHADHYTIFEDMQGLGLVQSSGAVEGFYVTTTPLVGLARAGVCLSGELEQKSMAFRT